MSLLFHDVLATIGNCRFGSGVSKAMRKDHRTCAWNVDMQNQDNGLTANRRYLWSFGATTSQCPLQAPSAASSNSCRCLAWPAVQFKVGWVGEMPRTDLAPIARYVQPYLRRAGGEGGVWHCCLIALGNCQLQGVETRSRVHVHAP